MMLEEDFLRGMQRFTVEEAFTERVAVLAGANGILTKFHSLRRQEVEAGKHPSVHESLAAIE